MAKARIEGRQTFRRRRQFGRDLRTRILVVCEGSVTEAEYLKSFRHHFRNSLVRVEVDSHGGAPKILVKRAAKRKEQSEAQAQKRDDDFLLFDEVWCVFDVDEHAHLAEARHQATASGIDLAVSNPCFELWALLHFQEQNAHLPTAEARIRLKRYVPDYGKALPFDRLQTGYEAAVSRAQDLDRRCEADGEPGRNPSTGVYRLTQSIREGGKGARVERIRRKR